MIQLTLALTITCALIIIAGFPVALAVQARGFAAFFVTIPAAIAIAAIAPILLSALGIKWGLVSFLVCAWIMALLVFLAYKTLNILRDDPAPRQQWLHGTNGFSQFLLPLTLTVLVASIQLFTSIGAPKAIAQTYDTSFHLNLVREMMTTGDASPLHVSLSNPGHEGFYPATWHALVSLVTTILPSHSIPIVANAVTLVICGIFWSIGGIALARAITGPSKRSTIVGGMVTAVFPVFPIIFAGYGVLYPILLATTLIPYALVSLLSLCDLAYARQSLQLSPLATSFVFIGSIGALTFSHPNALYGLTVLALPLLFSVWIYRIRNHNRIPIGSTLVVIGSVIAAVTLWKIGKTSDNNWAPEDSPIQTIINALMFSPNIKAHSWLLFVFLVLGATVTLRYKRLRFLIVSYALMVSLFVVARSFPISPFRTMLTGPWYNDSWRLAGLTILAAFPLVVIGVNKFVQLVIVSIRRLLSETKTAWVHKHRIRLMGAGAVSLLCLLQSPAAVVTQNFIKDSYANSGENAPLVSQHEIELLEQLTELVPENATIVTNPWNGGSLAYALSGRRVLIPHTGGNYPAENYELIEGLSIGSKTSCVLAQRLSAQYVLDFGDRYVFPDTPNATPFEGITDLDEAKASALTLVASVGSAKLYKVTGCTTQ